MGYRVNDENICSSASRLKLWVKKPNPSTPFPTREGGVFPPSPCRRGVGGEVFINSLFTHILKLDALVVARLD